MKKAEVMGKIQKVEGEIDALQDKLSDLQEQYDAMPDKVDVTAECTVSIGRADDGSIRMYLNHNGWVITRAGLGKVLELTGVAEVQGYSLVKGNGDTKRGNYFFVYKAS